MPYAWSSASGTVSQCVYWLSFCRPLSPSLASSCSCGIVGCMICMMIWAVMYGYTPSAATDRLLSAPPENRSKKPAS